MKFKYTNNKSGKYTRVVLFKSLLYDQAKPFYNYLCSFNTFADPTLYTTHEWTFLSNTFLEIMTFWSTGRKI